MARKRTHRISSEGHRHVDVEVVTPTDPTGVGAPIFRVTPRLSTNSTQDQIGTDENGTWESTYDTDTKIVTARTPTIGDSGGTIVLPEGEYTLWCEWNTVTENPVEPVGTLLVT